GLAGIRPVGRAAIRILAVKVRLLGGERVAEVEGRLGPGPAGVLPFGFGREAIRAAGLTLLVEARQLPAEIDGVRPADLFHWMVWAAAVARVEVGDVLAPPLIRAHYLQVLFLGHLVDAQVEWLRDGDFVFEFFRLALCFGG